MTKFSIFPITRKLNDAQTRSRKSLAENTENSSDGGGSPSLPRSQSGISVRSRRSIPSQKSASRTSVDEPTCLAAELHDLPEGSESGDSETATEVDVSVEMLGDGLYCKSHSLEIIIIKIQFRKLYNFLKIFQFPILGRYFGLFCSL